MKTAIMAEVCLALLLVLASIATSQKEELSDSCLKDDDPAVQECIDRLLMSEGNINNSSCTDCKDKLVEKIKECKDEDTAQNSINELNKHCDEVAHGAAAIAGATLFSIIPALVAVSSALN